MFAALETVKLPGLPGLNVQRSIAHGLADKLTQWRNLAIREARSPIAAAMARLAVSGVSRGVPRVANLFALAGFVRNLLRYSRERVETILGPRAAAILRSGDCDCYSYLLAVLAGASRIPVRWCIGVRGRPRHIWCELYSTELHIWIPFDCSTWLIELGTDPRTAAPFPRVVRWVVFST